MNLRLDYFLYFYFFLFFHFQLQVQFQGTDTRDPQSNLDELWQSSVRKEMLWAKNMIKPSKRAHPGSLSVNCIIEDNGHLLKLIRTIS